MSDRDADASPARDEAIQGAVGDTAARGLAWTLLKSVASRLVTAAVFIVMARTLDPEDFGTVALAAVLVVLISIVVEAGFAEALIQRKTVSPNDLNSAFWVNNVVAVTLALGIVAGADLMTKPLGQPQLAPVLRVLSLVFVFAALASVPQAILRRELAFRAIALRSLGGTLVGGAVGVAMAFAGAGVWSLVGQMVTTAGVGTAILWAMSAWRPSGWISMRSVKDLSHFSLSIFGERLAFFVSRRSDDFLIGAVLGPVALGVYSVAYRILLILTETIMWTLEGVAFPLLARLKSDEEHRRRVFYSLTQLCCAVATPAFLLLAVLAPELTRVAFGSRWVEAIPVMQILALVGIPHVAVYCNKSAMQAAGRADLSFRVAILSAVVNVIGFALVVRWGIVAVASSYVVCTYLLVPVSVWAVTRALGLDVATYLRLWAAPLASGLVMAGGVLAAKAALGDAVPDSIRLMLSLVVAFVSYATMLYLTAPRLAKNILSQARRLPGRR